MLNILKQERRYSVFDKNSYAKVLRIIGTMTTYTIDAPVRRKIVDYYYDDDRRLLDENELLLRRRVYPTDATLKIKRKYFHEDFVLTDSLRSHEREKVIGINDPLSRHYFFLNNALNSMFSNNLQFDPDKLFEQVRVYLTIKIDQENRRLFGYGGLKIEIRQEKLKIYNRLTNRKAETELLQFKLLSNDDTLPLFEDFITRVERHCKEIFYTKDSKHEIAMKHTRPLPTKEERMKMKEEMLRRRAFEEAGEPTDGDSSESK